MNLPPIVIYQKEWTLMTSDAERRVIKTGHFGACFVLVLFAEKVLAENKEKSLRKENSKEKPLTTRLVAMAHIDYNTNVASIKDIFDEFARCDVEPHSIRVTIAGGWKEHTQSVYLGNKIFEKIKESGCKDENIDRRHMFKKSARTENQKKCGTEQEEIFGGAEADAGTGNLNLLYVRSKDEKIAAEQAEQIRVFNRNHGNVEVWLKRFTS